MHIISLSIIGGFDNKRLSESFENMFKTKRLSVDQVFCNNKFKFADTSGRQSKSKNIVVVVKFKYDKVLSFRTTQAWFINHL